MPHEVGTPHGGGTPHEVGMPNQQGRRLNSCAGTRHLEQLNGRECAFLRRFDPHRETGPQPSPSYGASAAALRLRWRNLRRSELDHGLARNTNV
jgi:hypothetical protein